MDSNCRVVGHHAGRAVAIRFFHRGCRVRGLYPAVARPRRSGRKHSDQAAAGNDNHWRPCGGCSYGASNLQCAERVVAGLLHGHAAVAAGWSLIWSMIRKSVPSGHDPMGVQRFSEKIMLNQRPKAR
jgi:hypothetical protein